MKILRVFLKGYNQHYIDFPFQDDGHIANLIGFWKLEGVLSRDDPNYGVPASVPYDAWAFACVLQVEGSAKPGTSFDFLHPKPN